MNQIQDYNIKVSVIVPVFNAEIYLKDCLNSLVNQTLKDIEIIVIDDNSTDTSGSICDEFSEKDNRIIVIHNSKNIRQGLCRNKGIEIAKGEFVGFVDADDYVDLDFFEKLYNSAKTNGTNISKSEVLTLYGDGNAKKESTLNKKIKESVGNSIPLFVNFGYEHWTAIYKREKLIQNNILYPDIRNGQDDIFLLRCTYFLKSISLISNTFYYYRQHSSSTISIRERPYFESILEGYKLKVEFLNNHNMSKNDYMSCYYLALHIVITRYEELKTREDLKDFKLNYVNETIAIASLYKYDKYDLLSNFFIGFGKLVSPDSQLDKNSTYKVYKFLNDFKSKISKLFL